MRHVIMSLT